jgi:hypothetical protein
MKKTSLINENLKYETHAAAREFFELLTGQEIIYGEKINREKKNYSYDIANSLVNLIKDGSVKNVEDALLYCMYKTGIGLNMEKNVKRLAWNNLVEKLKDYNGGNSEISNRMKYFSFVAENKESKIRKSGINLAFIRADMDFDFFKNIKSGFYDHILLIEGNTPIRTYNKDTGEERSVRYEVLNGLGRVVTTPDKIAYTAIDVQGSYVYHQDSGHGWLEVPVREIKAMGLENRITPYSYLDRDKVYLEEDLDAGTFLDIRKLLPKPVDFRNNYMDGMCYIRDFPHYKPENILAEKEKPAQKTFRSKDIEWER